MSVLDLRRNGPQSTSLNRNWALLRATGNRLFGGGINAAHAPPPLRRVARAVVERRDVRVFGELFPAFRAAFAARVLLAGDSVVPRSEMGGNWSHASPPWRR